MDSSKGDVMQKKLLDKIREIKGPFTEELVNGWQYNDLEDIERHLDICYRTIFNSLKDKGIYYDGLEKVCPLEFYSEITQSRMIYNKSGLGKPNKTTKDFEISKNNFYGVRVLLRFEDPNGRQAEAIKQPLIYLPFTNRHGDVWVRDSLYSLILVLSERGPSVDCGYDKTIFIKVLCYKFKVTKEVFSFLQINPLEGTDRYNTSPLTVKLPANRFYKPKKNRKITSKKVPVPLLSWYIFGKYGFDYSMKHFAECEYEIGYVEDLIKKCKPSDGWSIYSSRDGKDQKIVTGNPNDFENLPLPGIAIKNKDDPNSLGYQYAASLLFMFVSMGKYWSTVDINDPESWRLVIGYSSIKLRGVVDNDDYYRQMKEHYISFIEGLVEELTKERYRDYGIPVENTYELFNYLILNYSNIILTYNPADLRFKELACKEFLLENLIRSANDFKFKIRSNADPSPKTINRDIDTFFKPYMIDSSIRENNSMLEQTGTDNPFIDYGLSIIRQSKSTITRGPGSRKEEFDPNHPANRIDASQPFIVSYQYASGPSPDGNGYLLPRVNLVNGKYTDIHPKDKEAYNATKRRLKYGK